MEGANNIVLDLFVCLCTLISQNTKLNFTRFLPRDAMLSAVYAVVVCLCVCHTLVLYQNGWT